MKKRVLIAGIGGASLGTEIFKSLKTTKNYDIFGVDVSPYAFGLYQDGFKKTFLIGQKNFATNVLKICKREKIDAVIPGGEKPLVLISRQRKLFENKNVCLVINSDQVIRLCTDKIKTFDFLKKEGIPVPKTKLISKEKDLLNFSFPCVMKPSLGSGGSRFLFITENLEEAKRYFNYCRKNRRKIIIQEYVSEKEGEYTVGVLSLPDGQIAGSIALKRLFDSGLSVSVKSKNRLISSGYSQGLINDFKKIREQAEKIAKILKSRGSLNVQGRVKRGIFYPFEINPRISASTYLRTMAGFNETDMYLKYLLDHKKPAIKKIRYGYYLRSLDENFVSLKEIKKL